MNKLAVVVACQYPVQGIIGFYVARHLGSANSDHPIILWKKTHLILLVLSAMIPIMIGIVTTYVSTSPDSDINYEMNQWMGAILLGFILAVNNVVNKVLFIAMGTWFNMISDESAGGTIITLLNSMSNMGRFFPRSPAFWLADTVGMCAHDSLFVMWQ
jgi:MFS transporter, PAT family, solute carrier family 33 (acetyl-CoA transportor), member 1